MTVTGEALRELHRIHRQLTDLRSRIERGPRQIKAGESSVGKLELEVEQAKELLKRARMTADEKQLHLKSREDRIEEFRTRLNGANSNKEFELLKEQIAADEQANSVQSDEILEGLERIDQLHEIVAAAEKELKETTKEHETRTKTVEGRAQVDPPIRSLGGAVNADAPSVSFRIASCCQRP